MNRLWTLRILGIVFIISASVIIYYNFTNSGRAPFWRNTKAAIRNIYTISGNWSDETGNTIKLNDFQGKISMMTFVYLDCEMTCPRIMVDLKQLDDAMKPRPDNFEFQIFLFQDPSKSSISIKDFRKNYGIAGREHWNILYSGPVALNSLADVFSIKYNLVSDGSRKYKHTNFYAIVSPEGKVIFQQRGFLNDVKPLVEKIQKENDES